MLRPHYSQTEFASDIYGTEAVYADNLAIDETLQLHLLEHHIATSVG